MLAYVLLARQEEKQVLEEFGEEYRRYQQHVPAFIREFVHSAAPTFPEWLGNFPKDSPISR